LHPDLWNPKYTYKELEDLYRCIQEKFKSEDFQLRSTIISVQVNSYKFLYRPLSIGGRSKGPTRVLEGLLKQVERTQDTALETSYGEEVAGIAYALYEVPYRDLPLYVVSKNYIVRIIVQWRLIIGK